MNSRLYRKLVPNAPLFRRTEGDESRDVLFNARARSARLFLERPKQPSVDTPSLISSYSGSIDRILLCFPVFATQNLEMVKAYRSLISSLRRGTQFVVAHHESVKVVVENWFADAGHDQQDVVYVGFPDFVNLTDWAEDAYVAITDASGANSCLMEPWEFKRAGDALIADSVEKKTDVRASQAPLIFQGGNCLVGSNFWLLGKDYFADTLDLLNGQRPPVSSPEGMNPEDFARGLFSEYVDGRRELILVGSKRPIPAKDFIATRAGDDWFLEMAAGGLGTFQPIFHIDMFITLIGVNANGAFEIMVGSPAMAEKMLGLASPASLNEVYDSIADSLSSAGFVVRRNPLVHWPTVGQQFTLAELQEIATQPGNDSLSQAVSEFFNAGATETTVIQIRDWHHITWNNCLVENSASKGRQVYLPTFGERHPELGVVDQHMKSLWEELGFSVHLLADFNRFAERQGVVHCIKKYLARGD